jgi:hypothetical protein
MSSPSLFSKLQVPVSDLQCYYAEHQGTYRGSNRAAMEAAPGSWRQEGKDSGKLDGGAEE